MAQWMMLLVVVMAISGCSRQVSITDDVAGAVDSGLLASGTDTSVDASIVAPLTETDDDPEVIAVSTPVVNPVGSPETEAAPIAPVSAPAAPSLVSEAAVRLSDPVTLSDTPGVGELTPVLRSPDGTIIDLTCCDEGGAWTGVVPLDAQQEWSGTILWQTEQGDEVLDVLSASAFVQGASPDVQDISPDGYARDTDSDGDGVNNLTELVLGTSPLNVTDASTDFLSAQVRVPRVAPSQAPIIDGQAGDYAPGTTDFVGEWENAVSSDINGSRLSLANLMHTSPGVVRDGGSENHHWLALHDGTWLYVLVIVDDAGEHHFDSQEVAKPWRDDSMEIFIDGDNSQQPSYDNVDDFSAHIVTLDTLEGGSNSSSNANPNVFRSINSVPLPPGLVFTTGPSRGPDAPAGLASNGAPQDVYEIALRLTDVNIEMARTFGFELQFSDDDDAGDRDAKWAWVHPPGNSTDNDFTFRDPRFMGRAVLEP